MKKNFYYLVIILLIFSCTINDLILDEVSFEIRLTNYTNTSWNEGTLYIGAKNMQGNFIATDSIKYQPVPSNISPTGSYNSGEFYDNGGEYQGYYYYKRNNFQFVKIPYPVTTYGSLQVDKDKITAISSTFGFVFKLPNGQEKFIEAYDLDQGLQNLNVDNRLYLNFDIKANGITGEATINSHKNYFVN